MTLPEMLAMLPATWLKRYEETQKVKPYELLEEYEKVEGKNYGWQKLLIFLLGLASMMLVSFLFNHNGAQKETLGEHIAKIVILVFISLLTWWRVDRITDAEAARSDLVRQLEKIGGDIQTLINLVGGVSGLTNQGIEDAQVRLAKAIVTEEMAIIVLCQRIVTRGIYETPSPIEELDSPLSRRGGANAAYDMAMTLIDHFVTPPHDFRGAKELAIRFTGAFEPDIANEQPLT